MQLNDFKSAAQRICESRGMTPIDAQCFIETHARALEQACSAGTHYAVAVEDVIDAASGTDTGFKEIDCESLL